MEEDYKTDYDFEELQKEVSDTNLKLFNDSLTEEERNSLLDDLDDQSKKTAFKYSIVGDFSKWARPLHRLISAII